MRGKVILAIYKKLEKFEYEKYGGLILEKYFEVEVWNLNHIFLGKKVSDPVSPYVNKNVKDIKSYRELIKQLNSCSRNHVFIHFLLSPGLKQTYYCEAIVSLLGFRYSMSYCQPYLCPCNIGTLKEDFKLIEKDKMSAWLNRLFPPMFNFVATEANYREFPSVGSIKKQNNILIHTLDYDNYLNIRDERLRVIQDKYIVFVDECYVQHADYQIFGVKSPFQVPENYYGPLNRFFETVESLFGYRIVVAVHPRGDYPDSSVFGNRELIKGQTARLIRDAEFVLCHTSTALDYVILFKKKFLVFYMDEIRRFYEWKEFYAPLLKFLNISALNVSQDYDCEAIKHHISYGTSPQCKKYRQRFIKKKGTQEELFFEIAAEHIATFFEKKKNRGNRDGR